MAAHRFLPPRLFHSLPLTPSLSLPCLPHADNAHAAATAHTDLYPHLVKPLFIRENQFDTAKLANCGWDGEDTAYLKAWGQWMREQLAVIAKSKKDGFFSGSCLQHGGNFGFDTSPVINGVHMRDAVSNWYFEKGNASMQYTVDDCSVTGGTGLPCTAVDPSSRQSCPHLAPPGPPAPPLSPGCLTQLGVDCPGEAGQGQSCGQCVRSHAADLLAHGCPKSFEAVFQQFCAAAPPPAPPPPPPPGGLSPACRAALSNDCPELQGKGAACGACVRQHAADLKAKGCPKQYDPVYAGYCASTDVEGWGPVGSGAGQGHHVCDLSIGARRSVFGDDASGGLREGQ